jgi:hypothetical protein
MIVVVQSQWQLPTLHLNLRTHTIRGSTMCEVEAAIRGEL